MVLTNRTTIEWREGVTAQVNALPFGAPPPRSQHPYDIGEGRALGCAAPVCTGIACCVCGCVHVGCGEACCNSAEPLPHSNQKGSTATCGKFLETGPRTGSGRPCGPRQAAPLTQRCSMQTRRRQTLAWGPPSKSSKRTMQGRFRTGGPNSKRHGCAAAEDPLWAAAAFYTRIKLTACAALQHGADGLLVPWAVGPVGPWPRAAPAACACCAARRGRDQRQPGNRARAPQLRRAGGPRLRRALACRLRAAAAAAVAALQLLLFLLLLLPAG